MFGKAFAVHFQTRNCVYQSFGRISMKKPIQSLWFLGAAALVLSAGSLSAQSTAPTQTPDAQSQSTQTPTPEAQQPQEGRPSQTPEAQQNQAPKTESQPTTPSQSQPSQTPDANGQGASGASGSSAQAAGTQSFSGTVVKSGDKYVLKDEASGKTYDIDHQDEVQKFDGKRGKVHGTLDASGKMIHLQ